MLKIYDLRLVNYYQFVNATYIIATLTWIITSQNINCRTFNLYDSEGLTILADNCFSVNLFNLSISFFPVKLILYSGYLHDMRCLKNKNPPLKICYETKKRGG